ncbi:MAG: hypothetical protein ABFR63_09425, partial [Thermodesulfobacteriota bacterium]
SLDETFDFGVDLKRFTTDLLTGFRSLILCMIEGCQELIDIPQQELEELKKLATKHSPQTIHMKLNLLMNGVEEMRYSAQPRLTLETTFLKVIQAGEVVPVADLLGKMESLLANQVPAQPDTAPNVTAKKKSAEEVAGKPDTPPSPKVQTKAAPLPKADTPTPNQSEPPPVAKEKRMVPSDKEQVASSKGEEKPTPHPHQRDVRRDWPAFIEHVKDRKVWMAQDLGRVDKAREVDNNLQLHFSDPANCALLRQKENIKLLTEFVLDFFQKDLKLQFITPDRVEGENADSSDSPHKLRQKLANDPLVIMATEIFSGQIGDIRVGPRSR